MLEIIDNSHFIILFHSKYIEGTGLSDSKMFQERVKYRTVKMVRWLLLEN